VKWSTKDSTYENDDPAWVEYFPYPTERKKTGVTSGEVYNAIVLGNAFCHCMVLEGFEQGTVSVPAGFRDAHLWSSTDADDNEEVEARREKMYGEYFPGVLLKAETETKKKVRIFL
jgi:hypothetical protein